MSANLRCLFVTVFLIGLQLAWPVLAQDRTEYDPVSGLARVVQNLSVSSGTVDVTTCLHVRTGPGMEYPILDCMPPGTPLQILDTVGDWYKINWNGQVAYCCAYWVHTKDSSDWHNPSLAGGDQTGPSGPRGGPGAPSGSNVSSVSAPALLNMPLISQYADGGSHPCCYCGPTTCRMVCALYGIHVGADEMALGHFGPNSPMYRDGMGSTHAGMADAMRHFGFNVNLTYNKSLQSLRDATAKGHPVIVGIVGNYGPFYTSGHITVVIGFTPDGRVIINDSAGGVRRCIPPGVFMSCWAGLNLEVWK